MSNAPFHGIGFGEYNTLDLSSSHLDYSCDLFLSKSLCITNQDLYRFVSLFITLNPTIDCGVLSSPPARLPETTVSRVAFSSPTDRDLFDTWFDRVKNVFFGGENPATFYPPLIECAVENGRIWRSNAKTFETWGTIIDNCDCPVMLIYENLNQWLFTSEEDLVKLQLVSGTVI